jgi:hypothetical protein
LAAKVPTTRNVTASTGLTGGGALSADVSLAVAYGTGSGTATQGNDSRITGALQAANNLSDLGSALAGRTNLGLASWMPSEQGLLAWTGDPLYVSANSIIPTAGTVYHSRLHCPIALTATNVVLYVVTAGSGLTAGQCFAALYHAGAGGALVAKTADLSSGAVSFATNNSFTFPLTGGPYSLAAGDYTVSFFANGTTLPALARFGNVASLLPNIGLVNGTYRSFTDSSNTGRTTTFPATVGTQTAFGITWFAGIS